MKKCHVLKQISKEQCACVVEFDSQKSHYQNHLYIIQIFTKYFNPREKNRSIYIIFLHNQRFKS